MGKRRECEQELSPLFETFFKTGNSGTLIAYLAAHSNLPGPRGNLELAHAFADASALCAEAQSAEASSVDQEVEQVWLLCLEMANISPERAPVNDPGEFVAFCGALGIGAVGAVVSQRLKVALQVLHGLANDPRWRMREGIACGLQRLIGAYSRQTMIALQDWIADGSWLELRAVAAAVAEPSLLKDRDVALAALHLHEQILDRVLQTTDRRSEAFKTLRQGLGYTLSVVVQALPEEGFAWLAKLVETQDADVRWIVRENLKKNRLLRPFSEQVAALQTRL